MKHKNVTVSGWLSGKRVRLSVVGSRPGRVIPKEQHKNGTNRLPA